MWQMHSAQARIRQQLLASRGEPLDPQTARALTKAESGDGLARDVRVHADGAARAASLSLGADALTIGNHIFLGTGAGASSAERQQLLRHEMTHVAQSRNGPGPSAAIDLDVVPPDGPQEQQARGTRSGPVVAGPPPAAGRRPRSRASPAERYPRHRSGRTSQLPMERPDRPHLDGRAAIRAQEGPGRPAWGHHC